jgi:hypothetical protein
MRKRYILLTIILACSFFITAKGQFYNGHQMSFGKNRVQYFDYYWSFYRFDDFDCYFNEYGRSLAEYTADVASKKLGELEAFFDYNLEKRLIFIIYNKNAEFKQSNIGLVTSDETDYNTGGYYRIIKNKVSLYYKGDHQDYDRQIASSITEVLINEILYNAEVRDMVPSSYLIRMPEWYIRGLVNYIAFNWDIEIENRVRDGIMSGKYKKINNLENQDAVFAGHSFWRYIGKQYGKAIIPNILYITSIYKNVEDGFRYVTGKKLGELLKEWRVYYMNEYSSGENLPARDQNLVRVSRKEQIYQQVRVSPDGNLMAYVTNDQGRKRVWIYNRTTGKHRVIFRAEPRLDQVSDETYPVIAWHPGGRILTFINEEKASLVMYFYRVEDKSREKRNLLYFDKVLDFSYSADGTSIVLSAVKDGNTDIFIHTISSGTSEQVTRDIADDLYPSFLKDQPRKIIFSSNRITDTLTNTASSFEKRAANFDLFIHDISKPGDVLSRLSEGKYNDRLQPAGIISGRFTYLGDNNGVMNRYTANFDSTISFIDTVTHYRYLMKSEPVTNYSRNILYQSAGSESGRIGEIIFSKRKYQVRQELVSELKSIPPDEIVEGSYRRERTRLLHEADSIEQLRKWLLETDRKRRDTLRKPLYEYFIKNEPVNISHYVFEIEKQNYYEQLWRKDYMDIVLDTGILKLPSLRIYQTSFYNNYLVSQIDFSFLNNIYQVYSQGAPYYNPGFNAITRFGITDLFENYRVTGGFRFSGDFDSNEYLVSVENLKGKFDKQLTFYRQSFLSGDSTLFKNKTHNVYLTISYPFSPVLSLRGTLSYRNDRHNFLSIDLFTLNSKSISRDWVGLKSELVYDNTRSRSINIYYGTRFKIFGEYYREITGRKSDMFVLGIDFRKYIRIHRELIWANRFAASTSFGPTKLIYFMGGVDNWQGNLFFNKYPMFDNTVPVNHDVNYGFQALATNLRGFSQNIRNGNNFVLVNSEIRWPFIRYFAGHPLRSNFLNSLQVVGFGDIGTAWTGPSPWAGRNSYENDIYVNGPVRVILDSNREPVVSGFGAGARAQLLGYFIRADWAWGIENNYLLPPIFYLSFSLDF